MGEDSKMSFIERLDRKQIETFLLENKILNTKDKVSNSLVIKGDRCSYHNNQYIYDEYIKSQFCCCYFAIDRPKNFYTSFEFYEFYDFLPIIHGDRLDCCKYYGTEELTYKWNIYLINKFGMEYYKALEEYMMRPYSEAIKPFKFETMKKTSKLSTNSEIQETETIKILGKKKIKLKEEIHEEIN